MRIFIRSETPVFAIFNCKMISIFFITLCFFRLLLGFDCSLLQSYTIEYASLFCNYVIAIVFREAVSFFSSVYFFFYYDKLDAIIEKKKNHL